MKTRLFSVFAAVASLVTAQTADWSDFVGSWNATYVDPVIDRVEGHVVVRPGARSGPLPVEVVATLRHPETGARTQLTATRVERNGPVIKLTLQGTSPSGPSASVPRQPGGSRQVSAAGGGPMDIAANELRVPPRSMLTVRLRGSELTTRATIDDAWVDPVGHELFLEGRLEPGADNITWQWSYPHPGTPPGLRGRRLGALLQSGQTIGGTETWARLSRTGIVAVEQDGGFAPAPNAGNGAEVFATLIVRGFSLPVARGNPVNVIFDDPLVRFERVVSARPGSGRTTGTPAERQDELRLQVRVGAGVATGAKNFSVNAMEALWPLRLPGSQPVLRLLTLQPDGKFAPSSSPCIGDTVRLEAEFAPDLPFDQRLARLRVGREIFGPLLFSRTPASKAAHTSSPFRLTAVGDPPAAAGELPSVIALGGDTLVVEGADSIEPVEWGTFNLLSATARSQIAVVVRPNGIWTSDASLTDLAKEDRFSVLVRVPANQAASLGDRVEVELLVRGTNRSTKLALYRRAARAGAPVVFEMNQPASFGGGIATAMFFNTVEVNRSILSVNDGETVEFKFRQTVTPVRVHNTALKKRLDVRRRQIATLLAGVNSVAGSPQLSPADRNRLLARAAMLGNALTIGRSPELFGAAQVAVLEAYLNLVNEPNLTPITGTLRPYGATYVFNEEANAVHRAIQVDALELMRDATIRMGRDVTVGMVEFVAERSGAGSAYTAVTGRTVMGQRVNFLQRILAAAGTISAMNDATRATAWSMDRSAANWVANAETRRQAWRDAEKKRRDVAAAAPATTAGATSAAPAAVDRPTTVPSVTPSSTSPTSTVILTAAEMPAEASARERMAERLRKAGVRGEVADRAVDDLTRRHPDLPASVAEAGIAADANVPAADYMQRAGITADQYSEQLDRYYRTVVGVDDPDVRARMTRAAMGNLTPPKIRAAAAAADNASRAAAIPPAPPLAPLPAPKQPPGAPPVSKLPPEPTLAELEARRRLQDLYDDAAKDTSISRRIADRPHTGRAAMDRLIEDEVAQGQITLQLRNATPAEIAENERLIRAAWGNVHPAADKVEQVLGNRDFGTYFSLAVNQDLGCTETEAVLGYFFSGGKRAVVDRSKMMAALKLDRAATEQALHQYLLKAQRAENPEVRARAIQRFLDGQ